MRHGIAHIMVRNRAAVMIVVSVFVFLQLVFHFRQHKNLISTDLQGTKRGIDGENKPYPYLNLPEREDAIISPLVTKTLAEIDAEVEMVARYDNAKLEFVNETGESLEVNVGEENNTLGDNALRMDDLVGLANLNQTEVEDEMQKEIDAAYEALNLAKGVAAEEERETNGTQIDEIIPNDVANQTVLADDETKTTEIPKNTKPVEPIVASSKPDTFFLNTFGTGSSMISNLLIRQALSRGLKIALPANNRTYGHPAFTFPSSFSRANIVSEENELFNLYAFPTRWQSAKFLNVKKQRTNFVSILRNPAEQFASLYKSANLSAIFYNKTVDEFLKNGQLLHSAKFKEHCTKLLSQVMGTNYQEDHDGKPSAYCLKNMTGKIVHSKNPQAFDLGLDTDQFENDTAIDLKIATLENEFDLIMITDYWFESLIMLRDLLGLKTEDMMTLTAPAACTEEPDSKFSQYNHADSKIYKYFKSKLVRTIADREEYYKNESEKLKSAQSKWFEDCEFQNTEFSTTSDKLFQPATPKAELLVPLKNSFSCRVTAADELQLAKRLRQVRLQQYSSNNTLIDTAWLENVFGTE